MPTTRLLLLVVFAYFGLCWTRSGQTLGMRAWRIRLEGADGGRPDWLDALVAIRERGRAHVGGCRRYSFTAAAGQLRRTSLITGLLLLPAVANFAWVLFDGAARSLQDHAGDCA